MARGSLFTRYFLETGIREMPHYRALAAGAVAAFAASARRHWAHLAEMPHPNEAETEGVRLWPPASFLPRVLDTDRRPPDLKYGLGTLN